MLRRVARVLRIGLFVIGVAFVCWCPFSFLVTGYARVPFGMGSVGVVSSAGTLMAWHDHITAANPKAGLVPRGQGVHGGGEEGWGLPALRRFYTFDKLSLPLWLLSAICLAWPVTSLLVARRRRKARAFEVQTKAESAVSTADS